jgi:MinD superfamily P-loop ATPase
LNFNITAQIFKYAEESKLAIIGSIPFDKEFVTVLIGGHNIVEVNYEIREEI